MANNRVMCPQCTETREIGEISGGYKSIETSLPGVYTRIPDHSGYLYCMKCKHEWGHYAVP